MRSECGGSTLTRYCTDIYMRRLNRLLGDVVISQGGVVPHIAAVCPSFISFTYCLIIRVQELLPSKSRYAIYLGCATSASDHLYFQQRKEGGGRLIFPFLLSIVSIIRFVCIFYNGVMYILPLASL
jgi:C-terminus of histone H2A